MCLINIGTQLSIAKWEWQVLSITGFFLCQCDK